VSVPAGGLRILLATDGSQGSARAEAYACALAQSWGASLTVMSVLEFPPGMNPDYAVNRLYLDELMQEATTRLADLKVRAGGLGLPVQSRIATGPRIWSWSEREGRPVLSMSCWEVRLSESFVWHPVPC
jgi:nucleotide-binding universal stress UspA family protein